jgi:hypothetical protein
MKDSDDSIDGDGNDDDDSTSGQDEESTKKKTPERKKKKQKKSRRNPISRRGRTRIEKQGQSSPQGLKSTSSAVLDGRFFQRLTTKLPN